LFLWLLSDCKKLEQAHWNNSFLSEELQWRAGLAAYYEKQFNRKVRKELRKVR
jgi:hypothetical protein